MDWNKFIEGGWEGIVVILGILGFVGSIFNHSRAEAKEKAKKAAPKPKHVHTQTTRKPTKRNVTQGTFTQSKQNKELAEQQAALQHSLKEVEREANRKKKAKSIHSVSSTHKRSRRLRGRLQEAIITKEILDKPVSLRKDR
ncbi:hypothetical protein ACP0AK_11900 [Listeria ivanovii]|uniref:Uncharacterized protein n=1 Tax=Listeria ivanovii (strain ATCC BAA-678 / PAM 55) TaxID=881621 RepID=G2ZAP2_LISIP|nr:hypothetical protein [Listeria ivanovii]AHI54926.1 hypothetical protein AX25_01965 [Listeria ivanovii WSLC3009]AIS64388.1 hypothetical protein JL52_01935 [Listeria ivanovii subsp. ivanovii]MBC1760231.1 hypothetical protein [Listeria ivanovii]MBK3915285.1 hypothetical protein [Listeria ivanovii subsp. ivanovii]MBK3922413.1 hypothetical protein [Listeria ivanovii subsp. ivanovii]